MRQFKTHKNPKKTILYNTFYNRLRPAFPYLTRLLQSTISLHGYTIPKGVSTC